MTRITFLAFGMSFAVAIVTAIATLTPPSGLPQIGGSDKMYHLLAFAALILPIATLVPQFSPVMAVILTCYGGMIELVQPLSGRSRDLDDQIANMCGIALGLAIGLALNYLFRRRHAARAAARGKGARPA